MIVLQGKDTFALCPIHLIKAANFIGATAMDKQELIEKLEHQVRTLKFETDKLKIKNNGTLASLKTEIRVAEDLRKNNAALILKNKNQEKTIKTKTAVLYFVSAIAIVEFFIIAIN